MSTPKQPDWEAIERDYRAGLLSVREIASTCNVSHVAIHKRAKRDGWVRDLAAKIKAKADALVNTQVVNAEVNKERALTEKGIVDANAQAIANVRMAHRTDIGRSRRLANKLLEELEAMTDENGTLRELIDQMREDEGPASLLEAAHKMASLPGRSKIMKELSETLKTLVALERQAYNLESETDGNPSGGSITRVERVIIDAPKH